MPPPPTSKQEQYQRKLARQRQLELMEATASGTAPPVMQLDVSEPVVVVPSRGFSSETDGSHLRSRPGSSASSVSSQQHSQPPAADDTGSLYLDEFVGTDYDLPDIVDRNIHVRGSFTRQGSFSKPQINLMDSGAGVYQEPSPSFTSRISSSIRSFSRAWGKKQSSTPRREFDPDLHGDAGDAREDDWEGLGYLGKALPDPSLFNNKRSRTLILMGALALAVLIVTMSLTVWSPPSKATDTAVKLQRYNSVTNALIRAGIGNTRQFEAAGTPEYHAARWLAFTDPANVPPTHECLTTRYALAVFYYSSWQEFERVAGRQAPVTNDEDELFEGVPNPGWRRKDYWLSGRGVCNWYGIECEPFEDDTGHTVVKYDGCGKIETLNLAENNVYGHLPPAFLALTDMETLDLSRNSMHGTFPADVGRLFKLKSVALHQNKMTGSIPADFGRLEGLEELRWGHNQLVGSLPSELARLYKLKFLALDNNALTGTIPDLSQCSHLYAVYLNGNRLNGFFPFGFAKLRTLYELYLNDNELTGTIHAEYQSVLHLRNFHAENNKLRGTIPDDILASLLQLREVTLHNNTLTGELPAAAGTLSHLAVLSLHTNSLRGSIPTTYQHMPSLESLHLQSNELTGELPSQLGTLDQLKDLWLQSNELEGTLPSEWGQATALETVYLEDNKLHGSVPPEWSTLSNLESLRIFDNNLGGSVPMLVCNLTDHRLLSFSADCESEVVCDCCTQCY